MSVTLVSSDGKSFEVDREVKRWSTKIKNMLNDTCRYGFGPYHVDIESHILESIIVWCYHQILTQSYETFLFQRKMKGKRKKRFSNISISSLYKVRATKAGKVQLYARGPTASDTIGPYKTSDVLLPQHVWKEETPHRVKFDSLHFIDKRITLSPSIRKDLKDNMQVRRVSHERYSERISALGIESEVKESTIDGLPKFTQFGKQFDDTLLLPELYPRRSKSIKSWGERPSKFPGVEIFIDKGSGYRGTTASAVDGSRKGQLRFTLMTPDQGSRVSSRPSHRGKQASTLHPSQLGKTRAKSLRVSTISQKYGRISAISKSKRKTAGSFIPQLREKSIARPLPTEENVVPSFLQAHGKSMARASSRRSVGSSLVRHRKKGSRKPTYARSLSGNILPKRSGVKHSYTNEQTDIFLRQERGESMRKPAYVRGSAEPLLAEPGEKWSTRSSQVSQERGARIDQPFKEGIEDSMLPEIVMKKSAIPSNVDRFSEYLSPQKQADSLLLPYRKSSAKPRSSEELGYSLGNRQIWRREGKPPSIDGMGDYLSPHKTEKRTSTASSIRSLPLSLLSYEREKSIVSPSTIGEIGDSPLPVIQEISSTHPSIGDMTDDIMPQQDTRSSAFARKASSSLTIQQQRMKRGDRTTLGAARSVSLMLPQKGKRSSKPSSKEQFRESLLPAIHEITDNPSSMGEMTDSLSQHSSKKSSKVSSIREVFGSSLLQERSMGSTGFGDDSLPMTHDSKSDDASYIRDSTDVLVRKTSGSIRSKHFDMQERPDSSFLQWRDRSSAKLSSTGTLHGSSLLQRRGQTFPENLSPGKLSASSTLKKKRSIAQLSSTGEGLDSLLPQQRGESTAKFSHTREYSTSSFSQQKEGSFAKLSSTGEDPGFLLPQQRGESTAKFSRTRGNSTPLLPQQKDGSIAKVSSTGEHPEFLLAQQRGESATEFSHTRHSTPLLLQQKDGSIAKVSSTGERPEFLMAQQRGESTAKFPHTGERSTSLLTQQKDGSIAKVSSTRERYESLLTQKSGDNTVKFSHTRGLSNFLLPQIKQVSIAKASPTGERPVSPLAQQIGDSTAKFTHTRGHSTPLLPQKKDGSIAKVSSTGERPEFLLPQQRGDSTAKFSHTRVLSSPLFTQQKEGSIAKLSSTGRSTSTKLHRKRGISSGKLSDPNDEHMHDSVLQGVKESTVKLPSTDELDSNFPGVQFIPYDIEDKGKLNKTPATSSGLINSELRKDTLDSVVPSTIMNSQYNLESGTTDKVYETNRSVKSATVTLRDCLKLKELARYTRLFDKKLECGDLRTPNQVKSHGIPPERLEAVENFLNSSPATPCLLKNKPPRIIFDNNSSMETWDKVILAVGQTIEEEIGAKNKDKKDINNRNGEECKQNVHTSPPNNITNNNQPTSGAVCMVSDVITNTNALDHVKHNVNNNTSQTADINKISPQKGNIIDDLLSLSRGTYLVPDATQRKIIVARAYSTKSIPRIYSEYHENKKTKAKSEGDLRRGPLKHSNFHSRAFQQNRNHSRMNRTGVSKASSVNVRVSKASSVNVRVSKASSVNVNKKPTKYRSFKSALNIPTLQVIGVDSSLGNSYIEHGSLYPQSFYRESTITINIPKYRGQIEDPSRFKKEFDPLYGSAYGDAWEREFLDVNVTQLRLFLIGARRLGVISLVRAINIKFALMIQEKSSDEILEIFMVKKFNKEGRPLFNLLWEKDKCNFISEKAKDFFVSYMYSTINCHTSFRPFGDCMSENINYDECQENIKIKQKKKKRKEKKERKKSKYL